MVERCFDAEDLAEIVTLPTTDPRRRHADECPRCRTLARRFRDFLDPAPLPPEADAEAAGRMLRQRLTTALPELAPALQTDSRVSVAPRRQRVRFARPLLAAAAVLVCCLGLLGIRNQLTQPAADRSLERSVLRGEDFSPTALGVVAQGGGLELTWGQPADTDASEAVFFDGNLDELATVPLDTSGSLVLAQIPEGARYIRIEFLSGGDVVASTRTVPVPATP